MEGWTNRSRSAGGTVMVPGPKSQPGPVAVRRLGAPAGRSAAGAVNPAGVDEQLVCTRLRAVTRNGLRYRTQGYSPGPRLETASNPAASPSGRRSRCGRAAGGVRAPGEP